MSFDAYVGDWHANITGNLGAFFAWALQGVDIAQPQQRSDSRDALFGRLPRDGLATLHLAPADLALSMVEAALLRIAAAEPAWLERFNAPNGWGCWENGRDFLQELRMALLSALNDRCPHCGRTVAQVRISL